MGDDQLRVKLIDFHRAFDTLTDIIVCLREVLLPPISQLGIICGLMPHLPIELWHDVVDPAHLVPKEDIGKEFVIILKAVGARALGPVLLVAVDAEGAYPKSDVRLVGIDGCFDLFDKFVYVVSSPLVDVRKASRMTSECLCIREGNTCHRIRIKVIIHVYGIDIITSDNVSDDKADVLSTLLKSGVIQQLVIVLQEPCWVSVIRV